MSFRPRHLLAAAALVGLAGCGSSAPKGLVIPAGLTDVAALETILDAPSANLNMVVSSADNDPEYSGEAQWYANGDYRLTGADGTVMLVDGQYYVQGDFFGNPDGWYLYDAERAADSFYTGFSEFLLSWFDEPVLSETTTGYKISESGDEDAYLELVLGAQRELIRIVDQTSDPVITMTITYPSTLSALEAPKDAKPMGASNEGDSLAQGNARAALMAAQNIYANTGSYAGAVDPEQMTNSEPNMSYTTEASTASDEASVYGDGESVGIAVLSDSGTCWAVFYSSTAGESYGRSEGDFCDAPRAALEFESWEDAA